MANLKALSSRIRSVRSIQKTVRVMQMISASKFRAARSSLGFAKEYCERLKKEASFHKIPDLSENEKGTTLLIVMSSDRGLCGGYNYTLAKFLRSYISSDQSDTYFLFVGKKAYEAAKGAFKSCGDKVLDVVSQPKGLSFDSFKSFLYHLKIDFALFDKISVLHSKFYSISSQEPVVESIFARNNVEGSEGIVLKKPEDAATCIYEPDYDVVCNEIQINAFLGKMYLAICESLTCEHCSRMIAMEAANSNTKSMLDRLVLEYNRSRQASITTDLIEVVSGCEALS